MKKEKPRQKETLMLPKVGKTAHALKSLKVYLDRCFHKRNSLIDLVQEVRKAGWSFEQIVYALPLHVTVDGYEGYLGLFLHFGIDPSEHSKTLHLQKDFTIIQILSLCGDCHIPVEKVVRNLQEWMDIGEVVICVRHAWGETITFDALARMKLTLPDIAKVAHALLDEGADQGAVVHSIGWIAPGRVFPSRLDKELKKAGVYRCHREHIKNHFAGR
jgi:hypothetical protein